jgi:hypothetical protein
MVNNKLMMIQALPNKQIITGKNNTYKKFHTMEFAISSLNP